LSYEVMSKKTGRPRGRPPNGPVSDKGATLTTRLRDDTRFALQASADRRRISLSQEVEMRLRQSLAEEEAAPKIHEAFGGAATFTIFMMAAECVRAIQIGTGKTWLDDPFLHTKAVEVVTQMMREFRPAGSEVRPDNFNPTRERLPDEYYVHAIVLGHLQQMINTRDEASLGRVKNAQGGAVHYGESARKAPTKRRNLGKYLNRLVSSLSGSPDQIDEKGENDEG
jgi:hypothetical protein